MQSWHRIICRTSFLWLLIVVLAAGATVAAEKVAATFLVKDSLAALNQQAVVEAKLITKGLLKDSALGGEPVELEEMMEKAKPVAAKRLVEFGVK